jgi:Spy/CpxP family protein refolding chaperone
LRIQYKFSGDGKKYIFWLSENGLACPLLLRRLVNESKLREVRKMKKITVVAGLVALMLIGAAYYAFAQGPGYGPGPGRMGQGNWGFQKGVNLTPEQKAKFQELRRKFNDDTAQLRGTLLTKRLELHSLWANPKSDSKAIIEKEREMTNLKDQLREKAVQMKIEARNILTPEQLAQIAHKRGMGHGSGHGSMTGPGRMMGLGGMRGQGQGADRCGKGR